jgi:hypothetical protein
MEYSGRIERTRADQYASLPLRRLGFLDHGDRYCDAQNLDLPMLPHAQLTD